MSVITSNTYTGDGTTVLFSVTFPYIEAADVEVLVNDVSKTYLTDWNFSTESVVQITPAPPSGQSVVIQRNTAEGQLKATFFPGSAIRARDLNNNFTQSLYVVQEDKNIASSAVATANTAKTTADTAIATANSATTAANSATSTANTANANASAAVTTANSASSTATTRSAGSSRPV